MYYILKLKEDYDIPYFSGIDPKLYYNEYAKEEHRPNYLYDHVISLAIRQENLDVVKTMVNKKLWKTFEYGLWEASQLGKLDIVRYFIEMKAKRCNIAAEYAASSGRINILKYFIEKEYISKLDFNNLLILAARGNEIKCTEYLINKGANNFHAAILVTSNPQVRKYLQTFPLNFFIFTLDFSFNFLKICKLHNEYYVLSNIPQNSHKNKFLPKMI